ncbi:hypothetical protein [Endozoicomonas sp. SESOKO1]|uniref:hypothetical protein n=1 Tax=Endozoicomonas sp. SESOKO1 TaxID=2828742 RepID=UPI0021481FA1|nr:hypothetical protein [Endozoicomonas sp. SESOKO1]
MGNPEKGFAGRTVKSAMTVLSVALIIAASSTIAYAVKTEATDKDSGNIDNIDNSIVPPYTELADGESRGKYKHKYRRVNRNPQDLSVSRDFKFYKQVASLDLTDPVQAETFLKFMDIRLAEKELNEEVVLVGENESEIQLSEIKVPEMAVPDEQAAVITEQSGQQSALKPEVEKEAVAVRQTPVGTKTSKDKEESSNITKPRKLDNRRESQEPRSRSFQKGNEEKPVVDKEKERARIARGREARLAREQAKQKAEEHKQLEERREAGDKARTELLRLAEEKPGATRKAKAEELRMAEVKHKGEGKAKAGTAQERSHQEREKERLLNKDKKEDAARSVKQVTDAELLKQATANILPSRPVAYQIASEQDHKIVNFDQAITRRFKVAGSFLDKGEHGNNIVKDHRGREFMNVMAFWDVLVESRDNGDNYYYGSIQFPLGSRHPAIIKSTLPGDEIMQGCKAGEVMVLKGFETEGIDHTHGLVDAYLAHSVVMPDGTIAFQEVVRQPSFSLVNVETGCMSRDIFSRSHVDPERMGHDKTLYALPVKE